MALQQRSSYIQNEILHDQNSCSKLGPLMNQTKLNRMFGIITYMNGAVDGLTDD